jgi:hypothetical protein
MIRLDSWWKRPIFFYCKKSDCPLSKPSLELNDFTFFCHNLNLPFFFPYSLYMGPHGTVSHTLRWPPDPLGESYDGFLITLFRPEALQRSGQGPWVRISLFWLLLVVGFISLTVLASWAMFFVWLGLLACLYALVFFFYLFLLYFLGWDASGISFNTDIWRMFSYFLLFWDIILLISSFLNCSWLLFFWRCPFNHYI